ncbi:MAG: SCO family protein [Rhodocyclaceae bacterium]|jgi:protein SCO1/2|nr:SCO family protein [Rhodocyclaceae bacterium]MBK6908130.1 SCO family protein [Rhodocyclaceae bacterium]
MRGNCLAVVFAALMLSACQPNTPAFHATDMSASAASIGGDLALTDHTGRARTLKDFLGQVVVVFFGYTQCPDVCPTNMSTLREVMTQLGPDSARVQVLFVSVDPERDTQELLAQYVPAFHPSFLGLYGSAEQTAKVAGDFRVFYQKQGKVAGANYTVDHSAGSYVFDASGKLRLYLRHGDSAANIADDLRRLLRGE